MRPVNGTDLRTIPNVKTARATYLERSKIKKSIKNDMDNLKIDISTRPIDTGSLTETITIPCSKRFKDLVELVSKLTDKEISELGHRYLLEGVIRDIKDVFSMEPYLDKSLREVLKSK